MKTSTIKTKFKSLLPALLCAWGLSASAQPVGQWDFKNGNLSPTVGSAPLSYVDGPGGTTSIGTSFGTTAALGVPAINGTNANIMRFPASDRSGGFNMPTPPSANGGSPDLVNAYSIVMDVLFRTNGGVRPLVQTDDGILTPDADLVVDTSDGIGAPPGPFSGKIDTNTWYRIAFTIDTSTLSKYINGVLVGTQPSGGLDNRLALTPNDFAQLFQNSTLNGAASGYVSSIQVWSNTLNAGQIAALGGPAASKIPTNIPVVPSFIVSRTPAVNITNAPPNPFLSAVLNPGSGVIDSNTITLVLDGTSVPASLSYDGTNYSIGAQLTNFLPAFSTHLAAIVYSDSLAGLQTNSWSFGVASYQNITLPTPLYLETFDEVPEGGIPAGWTATNWTDVINPGTNLFDTQSDSYLNWVTISVPHYVSTYGDTDNYNSPGFPNVSGNRRMMIPPIVENGVLLTNLASGNLLVAESDQRGGSQVQVIFTSDYNFTGQSNVYVSFHHINEQNQDNMCSVEYSIDQGVTWQPLLYMLDDGTTDRDGSDIVTNVSTGLIDPFATFGDSRNDQAHGLAYGAFIGAQISTNLIPYIRPCRNDDPVQQKRIELFRLPLADNQPAVRMRFAQAGTGSWFFDIDNLGFYTIPQPIILQQPTPVLADYNGPGTFTVLAGGNNLTYQWKFNGTNIQNATASTFTIAHAQQSDAGLYSVAVSNNVGSAVSDQESLSLVFTPVIVTAPQEQTIGVGESVNFAVNARGGRPLSYQWLLNSNTISGATNTSYSIVNAQTNQSGAYQVLVSNAFSSVLSPIAKLTVFAGAITNDMVVHLTFDGTYADSSGHGNNATNVNSPVFTNGIIGQSIHTMNNGVPSGTPTINNYVTLGQPSDLQFGSDVDGNAVDFSVSFWTKIFEQNDDQSFIGNKDWNSGGNPGWIIDTEGDGMKWNYRDSAEHLVAAEGSTRRDSPHFSPQMEDGGWHHVVVTFARHSVAKSYVDGVLTDVSPLGGDSPTNILGSVDTSSFGFNINIGQDGTGHYTDGGSASRVNMLVDDLAIWRRVLTDQETLGIFNAGLSGLPVDQATTTNAGKAPAVQVAPLNATAGTGGSAIFYVGILGSPTNVYQWYFGANVITNATNASITITNIGAAQQGTYSVIVTNGYGSTNASATLTYLSLPTITKQPVSATVSAGSPVTFTVGETGVGTLSNQWYFGTNAIPGATGTNYTIASTSTTNVGSYYCQVSNAGGSTNSATALLNVISGGLSTGLVGYYPFDGDYNDHSGNGNNGTPVGSPTFVAGKIGQAMHFTSTTTLSTVNYVTLGFPTGLQFDTNSFSIAFWVTYTDQGDDSPFISDKDWNSSNNQGWGIFSQSGGNFRVQATGTNGATKENFTATPHINDQKWHHIAASFWRGQITSIYLDGQLVGTTSAAFTGSVDVLTNAINIGGQDGTGHYTDGNSAHIDGYMDDVALWNRVITPTEVTSLYTAGLAGGSAFQAPSITGVTFNGTTVTITWTGGNGPFVIQRSSSLTNPNWTTVGTGAGPSATVPISGSVGYYRVGGVTH